MVFRSFVRPSVRPSVRPFVRPKMCNENEHGDPHFLLRHSKEELKIGRFTEGIFEIRFFWVGNHNFTKIFENRFVATEPSRAS